MVAESDLGPRITEGSITDLNVTLDEVVNRRRVKIFGLTTGIILQTEGNEKIDNTDSHESLRVIPVLKRHLEQSGRYIDQFRLDVEPGDLTSGLYAGYLYDSKSS